ncbi:MAG: metallophosphoesterase, partial [Gemmatimonadetes bacterium]|nr:metallophosphoesterase [Gemmatimonadota bacterium]
MRVLFVADVIGSPGRRVLGQLVRLVRADTRADV